MKFLYVGKYTERANEIREFLEKEYPSFLTEENPDIIIVAGGDGSMLHAIQKYKHMKLPFFGIGGGTLNFLMNEIIDYKEFFKNISKMNFDIVETVTIKACGYDGEKEIFCEEATNEIAFGNGFMDYHQFIIDSELGSFKNHSFKGQGFIISTALGSTAMSYNNGAQVIPSLDLPMWSISSCISEKEKAFKKITKAEEQITIVAGKQKGSINFMEEGSFVKKETDYSSIFIDGGTSIFPIFEGNRIEISIGSKVKLAFCNHKEFEIKRAGL